VRILLLTNVGVRTSDAGLLLGRALARCSADVEVIPFDERLPLLAKLGLDGQAYEDGFYRWAYSRRVLARARRTGADLVLVYGSNWGLLPGAIEELQRRGTRVALWEVNQRLWQGHQARCVPLYDHIFVLDSGLLPVLRAGGIRRVEHLCACADPEEHKPIARSPDDDGYAADLCFVGTPHPDRVALLHALRGHDLRIYGAGWAGTDAALAGRVSDEPVYGHKKTKIYSRSLISLNIHGPHMINGENFRVFEVAACGGVSFSLAKPDLTRCLEPGREVVLFKGGNDLRALVDEYLAQPAVLATIAAAGRERVLSAHTYDHRARSILDALECAR
jgi:spore maturation protein CgeB